MRPFAVRAVSLALRRLILRFLGGLSKTIAVAIETGGRWSDEAVEILRLLSSTKFSLNSCSHSGTSCNSSLRNSSSPSFLLVYSVSVDLCCKFSRSSSLVLPLLSGSGFSVCLLTSNTESYDEDVKEVGVDDAEELVDKPGTTNGKKFDALQSILLPFLVRCGF